MANVKITGLSALAEAPNGADLVEIVDDVAGTPVSKKITVANLMANAVSSYNDTGVTLTNTTTENTISVDQNGNVGTDVATDGAVHIENTGNTGIGLGVYSNIGATGAALVKIHSDNTSFDKRVVEIINDGTQSAFSVDQNGNTGTAVATAAALHIENTGNTGIGLGVYSDIGAAAAALVNIKADNATFNQKVVYIENDGTSVGLHVKNANATSDHGVYFEQTGALAAAKYGLYLYSNAVLTGAASRLARIVVDNSSSNNQALEIVQDGSGAALQIDGNGAGNAIRINHDDTGTAPTVYIERDGNNTGYIFGMSITVDNVGAGNLVCGIDFSAMSDTEPLFKFPSSSPDADLSTKSPETDAEAGWIAVMYGTTKYAMPVYALS